MTTGDRIKAKRLERGMTIEELAAKLDKNRATVYRYESNDIENLPTNVLEPLATALQTTPAYLMGWEDAPAKSIFDYENILPLPQTYKVPLIGNIACGTPIYADENIEDYIDLSQKIRADYCLRCKGDSMINARIFDGDIVFVRQQEDVDNGQIAVVLIDDVATLKRVYKQKDSLLLQAENLAFEPIIVTGEKLEHVLIQGLAVAFLSTVK